MKKAGRKLRRPNILFLMSDEHRPDVAGFAGNDVIKTPTLDRLAREGVRFTNAYTPSPVCVPGRQCMMAGQLPKTAGCEGWSDLSPGHMTFARRLAQYGYATVACGKLHHTGADMMQGWTHRIGSEMQIAAGSIVGAVQEEIQRVERPFMEYKWSDVKEIQRAGIGRAPNVTMDEYTVQGALQFIHNYFLDPYYDRETPDRPLLLKVSLLQPHYPYSASEDKFNYYLNRVRPFLNEQVSDHPFLRERQIVPGEDATEREIRRATAAYYAMVETVDEHFAAVLQSLEQAGQNLDDWIIIYTSDHGEMLGEHGVWEKQKFYEASAGVPLIIRYPKRFSGGTVVHENVSLCDLFATLCDLTDIPLPDGLDSRSLTKLMSGHDPDWINEAVSQHGKNRVMIKFNSLKYQYYGPDMPEVLFDLESDPEENVNVIHLPKYASDVERFRKRLAELGHGPDALKSYVNAGYANNIASV